MLAQPAPRRLGTRGGSAKSLGQDGGPNGSSDLGCRLTEGVLVGATSSAVVNVDGWLTSCSLRCDPQQGADRRRLVDLLLAVEPQGRDAQRLGKGPQPECLDGLDLLEA